MANPAVPARATIAMSDGTVYTGALSAPRPPVPIPTPANPVVKVVPDSTYTLLATDNGLMLVFTNAVPCVVTIPPGLPVNFVVALIGNFVRAVTVGVGVTVAAQACVSLVQTGAEAYSLLGTTAG